uniref:Methyltransferase domain protein n=1 Tax=Marseillevirus LCMAC101 TaxID=2506602 RepID=A0A481YRA7_9VIRU|nr:MAG: methyltransferase domain protein [Marseillevirus LCMAC101]
MYILVIILLIFIIFIYFENTENYSASNNDNVNIFTSIYKNNEWGKDISNDFKGSSGPGSSYELNKNEYIPFLKEFIKNNNIRSVADLGCGDWQFSKYIYPELRNIRYDGYDAYEEVINSNRKKYPQFNFHHLDFIKNKENIASADLCILREVLQHWCNRDIISLLTYCIDTRKFRYILICNCCKNFEKKDISNGDFRTLTAEKYPLNIFQPEILFHYDSDTKEVSLIS